MEWMIPAAIVAAIVLIAIRARWRKAVAGGIGGGSSRRTGSGGRDQRQA